MKPNKVLLKTTGLISAITFHRFDLWPVDTVLTRTRFRKIRLSTFTLLHHHVNAIGSLVVKLVKCILRKCQISRSFQMYKIRLYFYEFVEFFLSIRGVISE